MKQHSSSKLNLDTSRSHRNWPWHCAEDSVDWMITSGVINEIGNGADYTIYGVKQWCRLQMNISYSQKRVWLPQKKYQKAENKASKKSYRLYSSEFALWSGRRREQVVLCVRRAALFGEMQLAKELNGVYRWRDSAAKQKHNILYSTYSVYSDKKSQL